MCPFPSAYQGHSALVIKPGGHHAPCPSRRVTVIGCNSQVAVLAKLQHRFEFRVALIMSVALLIAQVGGNGGMRIRTSPVQSQDRRINRGPGSHETCNDCLAFAPLLSAAGAPAALPCAEPQGRNLTACAIGSSLVDRFLNLALRSRAPPTPR